LVETFSLRPSVTLYIEDNLSNLQAAADRGFVTHAFTSPERLAEDLRRYDLIDGLEAREPPRDPHGTVRRRS
jgi:hypothetical protein